MALELISFGLGANWIAKLWSTLRSIQKKRRKELDEINRIMFGNPLELARYYIEPKCQETNPADRYEEDFLVSREPIMVKIDQFFRSKTPPHPGSNQMFILSDAGMGKSSLLIMLKLLHLTSFWPKDQKCVLKKLGEKTIEEMDQIEDQLNTILLLDSLDEDPCAYGRVKERLIEILASSQNFRRVIITCRTQFFPDAKDDPMERPGLVSIEGYICPTKYLAFFDDTQVDAYLSKRFPKRFGLFTPIKTLELANIIIYRMGSLRARPMLLAYIEDLMSSPSTQSSDSEYLIYKILVNSWLLREQTKSKLSAEILFRACEILATELTIRHTRSVSGKEIDLLIARMPELESIKSIDIKGKSLLNRNSSGDYRFSHFTFQEFLVAHRLMNDNEWKPSEPIPLSDALFEFIQSNKTRQHRFPFKHFDLTGADLSKRNLIRADFSSAKLDRTNLSWSLLRDADFNSAQLSGVMLDHADLRDANLSGAQLTDVSLFATNLKGASISNADFTNCTYVPVGINWDSVTTVSVNVKLGSRLLIVNLLSEFIPSHLLQTIGGVEIDFLPIEIARGVDYRIAQAVIAVCTTSNQTVIPILNSQNRNTIRVGNIPIDEAFSMMALRDFFEEAVFSGKLKPAEAFLMSTDYTHFYDLLDNNLQYIESRLK